MEKKQKRVMKQLKYRDDTGAATARNSMHDGTRHGTNKTNVYYID